jgi:23S rRNA (guanosine2251-2'-O)-methyltransferase
MSDEIIFGIHSVAALVSSDPERFIDVCALKGKQDKRLSELINELWQHGVSVEFISRDALDKRANGGTHQGIIARIKPGRKYTEEDLLEIIDSKEMPFFLILDGVTDPHNLGACMRSADAAGVHAVIVPKDNSANLNATVRKTASGAAESIPLITVTNLARTIRTLQEKRIWTVGTAGEAQKDIYEAKLTGPLAIIMGSEDVGLRKLTRETCDELIKLPMAGSVSSLNVSVATGICLYEVVRQRRKK